jgi:hypothetical protein
VAMALQEEVTNTGELFDLTQPFDIDGSTEIEIFPPL